MDLKKDFPMLKKDIIYLDNGATTFKPYCVIDSITKYYTEYTANAHRGDYDISVMVDEAYEGTREKVRAFINAKDIKEIVFTSGATQSLNMIINGYFKNVLQKDDEVLITKSEHASLVLPWFNLSEKIGINIKYIEVDEDLNVTVDNIKKIVTDKTKVISLAHIPNVAGDIRPIKEITNYAHQNNILVVVDGAQSVPHIKVDVTDLDIDFLAFSGHKMLGPTGIGVLYGKADLLEKLEPQNLGGGMNNFFTEEKEVCYKMLPHRLEAGTTNIEGVIGLGAAIDYINEIGIDNIAKNDHELKKYAVEELSKLDNIEIYNAKTESGIIAFNVKGVFSQDTAIYLNKYKVCVRAGNHCAKIMKSEIGISNTCRISFYLYNNKEEIDKLVILLKDDHLLEKSL
ncbi:MAG: cysteine desulfurase [Bacilli bacterium]|nr:cysteine desulfurase [Bacilli bacterium]